MSQKTDRHIYQDFPLKRCQKLRKVLSLFFNENNFNNPTPLLAIPIPVISYLQMLVNGCCKKTTAMFLKPNLSDHHAFFCLLWSGTTESSFFCINHSLVKFIRFDFSKFFGQTVVYAFSKSEHTWYLIYLVKL